MLESEKYKKMQNMKCYAYIVAGVVFQTIIILVFALTVMRIKTPRVRVRSVTVQNLNYNASGAPHFNMTLIMEIAVKNTNFGHFRFENTTANITFGSVVVGRGEIIKSRARARKTKRMNVAVDIVSSSAISDGNDELRTELSSGTLRLAGVARLRGKVTLMKMMKKSKTAEMNCTMTVNLSSHALQDLDCE
ncbi:late embryogenesis abundant protein At1g64065-like [Durio zibethinus]|uniref:Late embryogenesis abundant protein At1g64065-like n=1 Tax=Durio zibethinus TaxID=66656 RepID=A0A6P5ZP02_DURZI|nr:late embryogenesis abundant protein At1g64065-like [Durio zibethinus]